MHLGPLCMQLRAPISYFIIIIIIIIIIIFNQGAHSPWRFSVGPANYNKNKKLKTKIFCFLGLIQALKNCSTF